MGISPLDVMNLPVFWYEWAAIAEAADNKADRERQHNAQSDKHYESIRRQQ